MLLAVVYMSQSSPYSIKAGRYRALARTIQLKGAHYFITQELVPMKKDKIHQGTNALRQNSEKVGSSTRKPKSNAEGLNSKESTVYPSSISAPQLKSVRGPEKKKGVSAVVYCERMFGSIDGKTANGLVRYSEKYTILAIIDSEKDGLDSGVVLGDDANGIPICHDLGAVIAHVGGVPDFFIFGIAPASGKLSPSERTLILKAMAMGMNIVSGLHEFLNEDLELLKASHIFKVDMIDVRMPRPKKALRVFRDLIDTVTCPRLAVLGTDCAIGKRTTATILTRALKQMGLKAVLISTGQTGLIQGSHYGVALDAVPSQFCTGELEATILEAFENEDPDILIVEGQGALSHPAFSTSSFILRGSRPHAVLLQHAPGRPHRCDFEGMALPTPASEIHLIETFSNTKVIGITINHENLSPDEVHETIKNYEVELDLPVADPLEQPQKLAELVMAFFPILEKEVAVCP